MGWYFVASLCGHVLYTGGDVMYPFVFYLHNETTKEFGWVVLVGCFLYSPRDMRWAANPEIGDHPLVPSLDVIKSTHKFDSEQECLEFVQKWWAEQDIASGYKLDEPISETG